MTKCQICKKKSLGEFCDECAVKEYDKRESEYLGDLTN